MAPSTCSSNNREDRWIKGAIASWVASPAVEAGMLESCACGTQTSVLSEKGLRQRCELVLCVVARVIRPRKIGSLDRAYARDDNGLWRMQFLSVLTARSVV